MKNKRLKIKNILGYQFFVPSLIFVSFLICSLFFVLSPIKGQTTDFDIDDNVGLEPIKFSFFPQISLPDSEYATVFSWLSFFATLASMGLVIFWVYLVLRAAYDALKSEGDSEKLGESFNRIKSTFIGATMALLFPILLVIFGAVLGLGPLWSWPAAFRACPNQENATYIDPVSGREVKGSDFYFQEVLRMSNEGSDDPKEDAEVSCGIN